MATVTCTLTRCGRLDPIIWGTTSDSAQPSTLFRTAGKWTACPDGQYIHISLFRFLSLKDRHPHADRIAPTNSVVVQLVKSASLPQKLSFECAESAVLTLATTTDGYGLIDVQADLLRAQTRRMHDGDKHLKTFMKSNKVRLSSPEAPFVSSGMCEADWAMHDAKDYEISPGMAGWPQMTRLSFSQKIYWPRAVACACILLGANVRGIIADPNPRLLDVLLVLSLTAFAGSYPLVAELKDDRSLGVLKLMTNRDCEDMALTACGVFHWMKAGECAAYGPGHVNTLAKLLHRHLIASFVSAGCVVCIANGNVAVPGREHEQAGKACGHVMAILCRTTGPTRFNNALAVESTRPTSPYTETLDTFKCGNGRRAFSRETLYDYKRHPEGLTAVKPLQFIQYHSCIVVHFPDESVFCATKTDGGFKVGVSLQALLSPTHAGGALRVAMPESGQYDKLINTLSHRPCYDTIDAAIEQEGWGEKQLGIVSGQIIEFNEKASNYTFVSNPRITREPGAMKITGCTAYHFKGPRYKDTAL